ncbi:MAG: Uma2 family endonuclease, partial [Cyanobacteria bacterium J06553_1]
FDHLYALFVTLEVLRQYLKGQQATVLGNQFLYYAENYPRLRVAPDVMVIFGVEPGGRDRFKTWEEGASPAVVFEMTSAGTRTKDEAEKYELYEKLGVLEYWQFDPKGEWISDYLRGYRLIDGRYQPITDSISQVLQLKLAVEDKLIAFYMQSTGKKLLIPDEMSARLVQAQQEAEQAQQEAEQAQQEAERIKQENADLKQRLRDLGIEV